MSEQIREEAAAAVAAHQALGDDYQTAIADSLVERIGAEIDRRVDARLHQMGRRHTPPARSAWPSLTLGLGSLVIGAGVSGAILSTGGSITSNGITSRPVTTGQVELDALLWVVIGAINVAFARWR